MVNKYTEKLFVYHASDLVLKNSYLVNKRGEDLKARYGDTEAKIIFDESSEKLYEYIYSHVNFRSRQTNKDIKEWNISKTEKGYITIRKALLAMIMYALRSSGDEAGENTGLNIKNSTYIPDFDKVRKNLQVSQHVHNILKTAGFLDESDIEGQLDPTVIRNGY